MILLKFWLRMSIILLVSLFLFNNHLNEQMLQLIKNHLYQSIFHLYKCYRIAFDLFYILIYETMLIKEKFFQNHLVPSKQEFHQVLQRHMNY
jgi:hypothetical protein